MAYGSRGKIGLAMQDFNKAIQLKPNFVNPHINRGITWLQMQAWDYFKSDLAAARNVGVDIAAGLRNAFGSIENFERITGIRLPEDIVALLTPPKV